VSNGVANPVTLNTLDRQPQENHSPFPDKRQIHYDAGRCGL
jgi:hypothetical protein